MIWRGDEFKQLVKAKAAQRLEVAAITLKNEVKAVLVQRDNLDGNNASKPGEPPAKVTGRLSSSISHEIDKEALVARVGTNVIYAKWLELGTSEMAARPFLRPVFEKMKADLNRIIAGR